MRTTQRKGDSATAQAVATFTRMGMDVSIPFTESAPYDLIVDYAGKLLRVQCKFCSTKDVALRRIHSNSQGYIVKKTEGIDYDWLYVLDPKGNEYLFKQCFIGRTGVRLKPAFLIHEQFGGMDEVGEKSAVLKTAVSCEGAEGSMPSPTATLTA